MESIELVEIYLEPSLVLLEPAQEPISRVFSGFLKVFRVFRHEGGGLSRKVTSEIDRAR